MKDFLNYVAERKYQLYHQLYVATPQAYTSEECYNRIQSESQYMELSELIDRLPLNEKKHVDEIFNELKI